MENQNKEEIMREYLRKYPWLRGYDPYPENNEEICCVLEWLPRGWVEAFGELLCEDLDRVIEAENLQNEFRIDEMKEKYGSARIYCHPCTPEINNVVNKYEMFSESICEHCGSIEDVKFTNFGWCMPLCRHCYSKIYRTSDFTRFNSLPDQELPDTLRWTRYSPNGAQQFEMDISETTKRIRERYAERKANGEFEKCEDDCDV